MTVYIRHKIILIRNIIIFILKLLLQISRDRKYLIDQHAKTPSHIGKCEKFKKSTALHQTLGQCLKNNSKQTEQEEFNKDLCQALVASNISLNKLNNINFQLFL